jgi:hypothetical protein
MIAAFLTGDDYIRRNFTTIPRSDDRLGGVAEKGLAG